MVLAEDSYIQRYGSKGISTSIILNLPEPDHFKAFVRLERTGNHFFYIGEISEDRCVHEILEALRIMSKEGLDFFMHFIGPISPKLLGEIDLNLLENKVKFYGRMDSKQGFEISKKCLVGISILKPIKNFVGSYSTKIFEYMAVGLPVITSNFKLYRDVIERYDCGYCIDSSRPELLAEKLTQLMKNEELARKMGKNGINAIMGGLNWSSQEKKIKKLYQDLAPIND